MSIKQQLAVFARRGVCIAAGAIVMLGFGAGVASAHVTAHSPDQLVQGGDGEITFRVPNEEDAAGTVKLQVNFSTTSPIGDVAIKPVPGWSARVTKVHLATPVQMAKDTVTDAVESISWTAQPGTRISLGEFQEFSVSVDGLPTNTGLMVMPTVQTYDNGDVVRWDQRSGPGQAEPEHPAPSIALVGSANGATDTGAASDGTARLLGGIGVAVGALGLGAAAVALWSARRRAAGEGSPARAPEQESR